MPSSTPVRDAINNTSQRCHQHQPEMPSTPARDAINTSQRCHQHQPEMPSTPVRDAINTSQRCHQHQPEMPSTLVRDAINNTIQNILRQRYSLVGGFHNSPAGQNLTFLVVTKECIQIQHNRVDQCLCISTAVSKEGEAFFTDILTPSVSLLQTKIACFLQSKRPTPTFNFVDASQHNGACD